MNNIMVLYNESSGEDKGKELAENFRQYAAEHGIDTDRIFLQATGPKVDAQKLVNKVKVEEISILVVIGGDGTINHVIEDFREVLDRLKIGLLPGGTVNNMARVLDIPLDFEKASQVILDGNTKGVDYGMMNDRAIISTMTIGILADTAAKISQKDKQKYGKRLFIKNFVKLLFKKKRYALSIKTDQKNWQGKVQLLTVTMTNSVGGFTNFDDSASADDGLFHVTILPHLHFFPYLFRLPKIIKGKFYELPNLEYFQAGEVEIKSLERKQVATRVDGDPCDDLPVKMTMYKHGLQIFVPTNQAAD
jgi:YegS/Rv2252/BmrU family lipid kinase